MSYRACNNTIVSLPYWHDNGVDNKSEPPLAGRLALFSKSKPLT